MKNNSLPSCRESGSVAVLTLWAILFLAFLSVGLSHGVATRLLVASDMKWGPQVHGLASKALANAFVAIKKDETILYNSLQEPWANDATRFKEVAYGGGTYSLIEEDKSLYGLEDEERKINLNRASSTVLSQLFQNEGKVSENDANTLAEFIVDWRDADERKGSGSETESCSSESLTTHCKNGDFEVLEELLWMPGMTVALFEAIKNDLTLYGTGLCNINTATVTSLRALGLSESSAEKVIRWRSAGNVIEDVSWITGKSGEMGLDATDQEKLRAAIASGQLGIKSDAFHGRVQAKFGDRVRGQVSFVISRDGQLKEWKE